MLEMFYAIIESQWKFFSPPPLNWLNPLNSEFLRFYPVNESCCSTMKTKTYRWLRNGNFPLHFPWAVDKIFPIYDATLKDDKFIPIQTVWFNWKHLKWIWFWMNICPMVSSLTFFAYGSIINSEGCRDVSLLLS